MKNLKFIFALVLLLSVNFTACTPDDITDADPPTTEVHAGKGKNDGVGGDDD